MALIVEDGTGLANAESYVSVAYFRTYCTARGHDISDYDDTEIEQALRRGTEWFEALYSARLPGARVSLTQALTLPQTGLYDARGYAVASNAVPVQVQKAVCEATLRELATPGGLSPDLVTGQIEKRVRVDTIEVEYASGSTGAEGQRPTLTIVDGIMSSLLRGGFWPYGARAVRA